MLKPFFIFILMLFSLSSQAQHFDHSTWNTLLKTYVTEQGNVNYEDIKSNIGQLNKYLNELKKTPPNNNWSKTEKLAYWINAYNAFTVKLIIDNYPIKSIKDIDGPWDIKFIPILEKKMSLNTIEHEILRKMDEPRIHFAIVCASISCPKLSNEAFTASKLEIQLKNSTCDFLEDTSKNSFTETKIEISKIFKWFSKDFKQQGTLIDFLNQYSKIRISKKAKIRFKDYNWSLNE